MEISIIIPTYNRKDITLLSLKYLNNQTAPKGSFEVILSDDGSTDGTGDGVTSLEKNYPFKYLYQKNQGQSAAFNHAIENAEGRILLFMDDDALAKPEFVEAHLEMQKNRDNLIVRGPIINTPLTEIPMNRPIGFWDMNNNYFCSCNVSVAKKHIVDIGMYDPEFFWWKDAELGFRLRKKKLDWKFCLKATVFHYKPFHEDELDYIKKWATRRGKYAAKLYKKHPHWRMKLATGIHWFTFLHSAIFTNSFITDFFERIFNTAKDNKRFYYRAFLTGRIGNYYYLKAVKEERGKSGK